jgi:hypothetical protein
MIYLKRSSLAFWIIIAMTISISCGEDPQLKTDVDTSYSTMDAAARETDPLLESDLSSMSLAEKQRLLSVLKTRNKKEALETKILRDINKQLCSKMTQVKKECTALAPLMIGTYDTLKCSEEELKNEIVVTVSGQYQLVADNLYESNVVSGTSKVTFSSVTGAKDIDVRFIDITKLVLKSKGGTHDSPSATNFELTVNGIKLFVSEDLKKESGNDFRVSLSKFLELSKSSSCNVPRADLDHIRNETRSKFGAL